MESEKNLKIWNLVWRVSHLKSHSLHMYCVINPGKLCKYVFFSTIKHFNKKHFISLQGGMYEWTYIFFFFPTLIILFSAYIIKLYILVEVFLYNGQIQHDNIRAYGVVWSHSNCQTDKLWQRAEVRQTTKYADNRTYLANMCLDAIKSCTKCFNKVTLNHIKWIILGTQWPLVHLLSNVFWKNFT